MPLQDAVGRYVQAGRARFHMPGHKGADGLTWDITEVDGCDSLYEASGPILELEQEAARIYGAGASLLSAGGATLCIQTMLALCGVGAKIVVGRGLHRSAVNAMILLGQEPVWVYPQPMGWFRGPYSPDEIAKALEYNRDAAAVYITSPDYFGVMSDVNAIAAVCRNYGKPLLVDNAHGAHLKFTGPRHPLDCGAAMCADSLHKTLPAMTGGALLHLADSAMKNEARRQMALFGSTSPSYPILLSCERALTWAQEQGREAFMGTAAYFARLAAAVRPRFPLAPGDDPAKLAFAYGPFCGDGAFGNFLRIHGVEPEYTGGGVCVLMGSPFNREEDYMRVQAALDKFPQKTSGVKPPGPPPRLEKGMGLREAASAASVELPLEKAVGRIAAQETAPCPPGIPVVISGERIDGAIAAYLARCGCTSLRVVV